ncbi:MAG: class I SAM-dependent methyltransferase, partial [Candidatus Latescibacterota bacterium]|nr:class I SAM-dependent methyltransferase [Candidatus Latescibacterota bacterium]
MNLFFTFRLIPALDRTALTFFYLTLAKICHTIPALRRAFWKYVYERLARSYTLREWTFMNYGYLSDNGEALELSPEDEPDRNLITLYHHIADAGELRGKRVLEVGCGRGGGSSYVTKYMQPSEMVSIDISENAVEFCRNRHHLDGLEFRKGDAESLPFEDNSFDAVLNVESSHCYGSIGTFFGEVYRVLKPRGSFLYADFRPTEDVDGVSSRLAEAGFVIRENEDITRNVLAALEQDSPTKQKWISDLAENHIQ